MKNMKLKKILSRILCSYSRWIIFYIFFFYFLQNILSVSFLRELRQLYENMSERIRMFALRSFARFYYLRIYTGTREITMFKQRLNERLNANADKIIHHR